MNMFASSNNIYSPNFGAVRIKPKGINLHPEYKLVELNTNNILDIKALDKASYSWLRERNELGNSSCHYLRDIWTCVFKKNHPTNDNNKYNNIQIFALTKQRSLFHWLDFEKILAVAQIRIQNEQVPRLDFIEVRPKYQHAHKQRATKGIGTYFLDCLKSIAEGKRISIFPDDNAIGFYKKYGAYPDEQYPDLKCYI